MSTGFLRQYTRAANLSSPTAKSDRADAAIRRVTDAVLAKVARADAERGQVMRDAVAKVEACEAAP